MPASSVKISVVIPCYNVEQYIERAIQSVIDQEFFVDEIICVNNNSSDRTVEIIEQILSKDNRIQLLHETRRGASYARNTGTAAAKGIYIQYLDADDYLLSDKIKSQFPENDFPDLIWGGCKRIDETSGAEQVFRPSQKVWSGLMRGEAGNTCANLWKREAVLAAGGWYTEQKSSQEYELMFRMLKNNAVVTVSNTTSTIVTLRQGSISTTNRSENLFRFLQLRAAIYRHVKSVHPEVFRQETAELTQALFTAIRMAYPGKKVQVLEIYNELIPAGFKPQPDAVTGKSYCFLYKLFGFSLTEKIKAWLR
ncbi:MAG: glycosyltransferase family 2 protein [Bacteroidota bacterium]